MILVKKGGKLPEGHIQSWFWERGNLKDSLPLKLPPRAPTFILPLGRMLLFYVLLHATYQASMLMQLVNLFLLCADIASKVKVGQTEFKRYPENLLNSRVRYGRAFQVRKMTVFMHCHWKQQP